MDQPSFNHKCVCVSLYFKSFAQQNYPLYSMLYFNWTRAATRYNNAKQKHLARMQKRRGQSEIAVI